MDGDRIARAMARIEAAAGRIEAAEPLPATSRARPDSLSKGSATDLFLQDNSELEARYAALQSEARHALAEIDRLIAELEE